MVAYVVDSNYYVVEQTNETILMIADYLSK
jgi:hypothetical protein